MGGLVCAVHRRKNKGFPTLKRTLNLGIEKGRLLKNSRPKGGLIQVICYPASPETVDITGFFEKFCIAIRTSTPRMVHPRCAFSFVCRGIKKDTPFGVSFLAEREGFEPSNGFIRYTISNRAPSTSSAISPDGVCSNSSRCSIQWSNIDYYSNISPNVKRFFQIFQKALSSPAGAEKSAPQLVSCSALYHI